jgi:hypothetical protein
MESRWLVSLCASRHRRPLLRNTPVQAGGAQVVVDLPTGVLGLKAGPAALLFPAQGHVPVLDLAHGERIGGVLPGVLRAGGGLAGRFVGEEDIVGPFDTVVETWDARLPLEDVAQLDQDGLEPVLLQLGVVRVGLPFDFCPELPYTMCV